MQRGLCLRQGESLAYTTAKQLVKALEAKLSCLWRNENQEKTQEESSTEACGFTNKNGGNQQRSLCFEECVHMVDIITTVLDLADELQIQGKDVFDSFIGCFFLLKVYCRGPWLLPDDIEKQKKYHHSLIMSGLVVFCGRFRPGDLAVWTRMNSKDAMENIEFLLNDSLCESRTQDWEMRLCRAIALADTPYWSDANSYLITAFYQ